MRAGYSVKEEHIELFRIVILTSPDRHRRISCIPPLLSPLLEALEQRPAKQSNSTNGKCPYDDAVFDAVSLEAECHNVLFLGILAYIELLTETEGLRALGACRSTGGFRSEALVIAW